MNKFTKLILTSAITATSGFASDMANFQDGGEVQTGATIDFQGQTLTLSEGKSLDVYGSLTGTGTIKCSGDGKVNVYGNTYKQDDTNKDAILSATGLSEFAVHTLDETNKGHIDETVIVDPAEALNKTNADLATYASSHTATDLVYVANSSGTDTKCVGKTDAALEVSVALGNANASIEGLVPSSLVMENKLKFTGDNSGFKEGTVTIGTIDNPAEVEYATPISAFQTDTTVEKGSKLTISPTEGLTLSKDLTVNGSSKFSLNEAQDKVIRDIQGGALVVNGKLIIPSGTKLQLGTEYDNSPIAGNPSEYPKVMSWPVSSFSNPLTEVNKNYYTVTFSDGSTLNFYYDEQYENWNPDRSEESAGPTMIMINQTEDGGLEIRAEMMDFSITKDSLSTLSSRTENGKTYYTVPLKYDLSVEIYEDPDSAGQYKTDAAGYDVWTDEDNIIINGHIGAAIKTLTKDEVDALSISRKELIYAKDDVFSYTYDDVNENWVRRYDLLCLDIDMDPTTLTTKESRLIIDTKSGEINLYTLYMEGANCWIKDVRYIDGQENMIAPGSGSANYIGTNGIMEGNTSTGFYINTKKSYAFDPKKIASALESGEKWMTLEEYNTAHGTSYTWKE